MYTLRLLMDAAASNPGESMGVGLVDLSYMFQTWPLDELIEQPHGRYAHPKIARPELGVIVAPWLDLRDAAQTLHGFADALEQHGPKILEQAVSDPHLQRKDALEADRSADWRMTKEIEETAHLRRMVLRGSALPEPKILIFEDDEEDEIEPPITVKERLKALLYLAQLREVVHHSIDLELAHELERHQAHSFETWCEGHWESGEVEAPGWVWCAVEELKRLHKLHVPWKEPKGEMEVQATFEDKLEDAIGSVRDGSDETTWGYACSVARL